MAETKNKYQQKLKVMNKLFESGCGTEKELQEMSLEKILASGKIGILNCEVDKDACSPRTYGFAGFAYPKKK